MKTTVTQTNTINTNEWMVSGVCVVKVWVNGEGYQNLINNSSIYHWQKIKTLK